MELISAERWRDAAKTATPEQGLRKEFIADVEAKNTNGQRQLTFTISTSSVDRQGDTVDVGGWETSGYRKNPVVLWGHDHSMLPIGRSTDIWVEGGSLKSTMEPTPAGLVRFNDVVFDLFKGGFLSAVSVGFRPLEFKWSDDKDRPSGIDFKRQELLEFSAVTVPANADALIEARSAGIDIEPIVEHAVVVIRSCVKATTVRELERALRDVGLSRCEAKAIAPEWFSQREVGTVAAPDDQALRALYEVASQFLARAKT